MLKAQTILPHIMDFSPPMKMQFERKCSFSIVAEHIQSHQTIHRCLSKEFIKIKENMSQSNLTLLSGNQFFITKLHYKKKNSLVRHNARVCSKHFLNKDWGEVGF